LTVSIIGNYLIIGNITGNITGNYRNGKWQSYSIYDTFRMAPLNCCWWHSP